MEEKVLTQAENVRYLLQVLDGLFEKEDARDNFLRKGLGRRQDHGTRGNSSDKGHGRKYADWDWFGSPDDYETDRRHKDYVRGSNDLTRGVVRSSKQRELLANEINEALLEAGLICIDTVENMRVIV